MKVLARPDQLTKVALIAEVVRLRDRQAAARKARLGLVERFGREKRRYREQIAYYQRGMRELQRMALQREDYLRAEQILDAERDRTAYWQSRSRILALALARAGQSVPPDLDMSDVNMNILAEALDVQHMEPRYAAH